MYSIGQYIRLTTSDDWNNMYGIISNIENSIIHVFCINMPCYQYFVDIDKADNILTVVKV